MSWTKYLALPPEITPFERQFLARLNIVALVFFYLHMPAIAMVAWANDTSPRLAVLLSLAVMIGPTIAHRMLDNPRSMSIVHGITAMFMGGLLVHFGQGPLQIEMHFYFFALLAILCMFANPAVNIAAALTVALHHLVVWWLLPSSVFNYSAQWWVVLVHAAFVVLETVAACYISRQFFDSVVGLEKIVEARTATIREQQREMRTILNNVEEGLLTINLDGRMASETSRAVKEWFGVPLAGENFAAWIGTRDANFGDWLGLGLEGVREGLLPVEMALEQLPSRISLGERTYAVHYRAVVNEEGAEASSSGAAPGKLLVMIADITEALCKQAAERYHADLLQAFQCMLRDKTSFLEFLAESDEIVNSIRDERYSGLDHLKRLVHTLKGNSAIFGMRYISEICHQVENDMAEPGGSLMAAQLVPLDRAWGQIRADIEKLIGEAGHDGIQVDGAEFAACLKALHDGVDAEEVARMIGSWRLEPTRKRLATMEQQLRRIAERMGKSNVVVTLESNDLRASSDRLAPFWAAMIHVLRNAVDHGVEDREERLRQGKPEQSVIRVATAMRGDQFVVTVEDDGPGVAWDTLRRKASELGIAGEVLSDPVKLICQPGLSTKDTVDEFSGRGTGMDAMAEVCRRLGGTMEISTRPMSGTRVEFTFPENQDLFYDARATALEDASTPV